MYQKPVVERFGSFRELTQFQWNWTICTYRNGKWECKSNGGSGSRS